MPGIAVRGCRGPLEEKGCYGTSLAVASRIGVYFPRPAYFVWRG